MRVLSALCLVLVAVEAVCTSGKHAMVIHRIHASNSYRENVQIWEGPIYTGKHVGLISGKDRAGTTVDFEFCVNPDVHTLLMSHSEGLGWTDGSYLDVQIEGVPIAHALLDHLNLGSISVYPYMHHTPSSSWRYSNTASGDWFAPSADVSSWTVASPSYFPAIESTVMTRYYRATVAIPTSFEGIGAFEVGVFTKYGYIVYVDGQEVLRANLPETVEESTPCSSVSDSAEYRRVSLPIHTLSTTGSVTLAVAIHFDAERTTSFADPFKGFFTLVAAGSSRGFSASFETDHPSPLPSESHEMAFDENHKTKWTSSTMPVYNMAVFSGRQFVNAYSVMSSGGLTTRRPTRWTLSASNDKENWVLLDQKEHIHFTSMYQTKTFALPHNAASYAYFKFTFEASEGTELEVGRLQLLVADVAYAQTPALAYGAQSFDLFVGQTVEIAPTAGGFHDFQLTGSLPAGLVFSALSGTITGTPSAAAASTSVQISAQYASTAYSATLAFAVDACTGAKRRFDVVKHDMGLGSAEKWELLSGETVLASHVGRDIFQSQSAGDETFAFCAAPGTFKLVLSHAFKRGWVKSAYIDVLVYADAETTVKVVHAINLLSEDETVVTFSTLLLSDADMTQWTYKADGTVPANWYAASFSETWDAVPAARPTVAQSVWLFRRTIAVSSITGFMGFEMRTLARAGVVVYLNGEEVHRANVNGAVTASSTSTATTTTSEWRTFTERVGAGHLIAGENVFAVAVVNRDAASAPLDTVITIRLLTEKGVSLGLDTTVYDVHHNNQDSVAANLFHGDYSKRHISTATENHLITAIFNHGDRHFANMYCIVGPWNGLENAPKTWTVEVSADGSSFTQVSAFNNERFDVLYERKCYVLSSVTAPVRALRFHITAIVNVASSNLQINAIDLYMIDPAQLALPQTLFAQTDLSLFLGEQVVLRPTHEYFSQCSALSPFPTGLTVRSNGVVFGAPTVETQQGSYQMTCTNAAGQEVTATLQIAVVPCHESKSLLRFVLTNLENAGTRMVMVVSDATGTPLFYDYDMPNYALTYERAMCVDNSVFTFALIDRTNEGWKATYNIWVNNENVASGTVPVNASPKYVVASSVVFVKEGTATVEYQVSNSEPPAGWFEKATVRNWKQGVVGSLDKVEGITSYYCLTFNALIHELFVSYLVGVYTSGGFIMYLNGKEVNRVRLPEGVVTKDTRATESASSDFVLFGDSIFTSALVDGENFLCVELHKRSASPNENNNFDIYVTPKGDERELLVGGTVARSHEGYDSPSWHETWDKVFDKNTNTKFFSDDDDCSNVWFEYTLPNQRKEWVSRAEIWKGNGLTRNPSSLRVQASDTPDKKSSWETLGFVDALKWTVSGYGEKKTMHFLPSKPYRAFRLVANGCDKEGIEIGEWLMYSSAIQSGYCRGENGVQSVLDGKIATGPCDAGFVGVKSYQCTAGVLTLLSEDCKDAPPSVFAYPQKEYNLETRTEVSIKPTVDGRNLKFSSLPKMPEGLTLDPATGEISGKPKSPQVATKYIIMAANDGGNASTDVTLTITRAKLPIWLWIVIVVVALAVIAGIVMGIIFLVKKKQEARKKNIKKLPKAAPKAASKGMPKAPAKPEVAAANKPKIAV